MYAISTVGSLLGTFLAALLLIPLLGTQRTFLTFALALAIVAALGLPRRWWLVPLGVAALFAVPVGTVKASDEGRVIHETETEYQYARVIERPNGERTLELNEGQAIHSLYRPHSVLTGGYWDDQLVTRYTVRPAAAAPRRDPRLRRRHHRARLRPLPPGHAHRRRRDRRRAVRHRAPLLRRCEPRPQLDEHAEDARPFLRHTTAALRRDLRRRLPAAVHPVLPLDAASSSSSPATA